MVSPSVVRPYRRRPRLLRNTARVALTVNLRSPLPSQPASTYGKTIATSNLPSHQAHSLTISRPGYDFSLPQSFSQIQQRFDRITARRFYRSSHTELPDPLVSLSQMPMHLPPKSVVLSQNSYVYDRIISHFN